MDTFTLDYKGQVVEFTRVDGGYAHQCPAKCCRAFHWIETDSGTRHRITSAPGAPVTIVGSLWCPCTPAGTRCAWHVFITDGVARDA